MLEPTIGVPFVEDRGRLSESSASAAFAFGIWHLREDYLES